MDVTRREHLEEACYEAAGLDRNDTSLETDRKRRGIDLQTRLSLEYLKQAGRSARLPAMRRYARYNLRTANAQAERSDKPQFGFLIMIFGWLLQWAFSKAADTVWQWWKTTPNAHTAARIMATEMETLGEQPPATWEDEYGDN